MPVHKVIRKGKLFGWQWGRHKIYPVWKFGNIVAKRKAQKQGVAVHLSGWKEK